MNDIDKLMKKYEHRYSFSDPLIEDVRKLNYKDQAKVLKEYHKALVKNPYWNCDMFFERFEEDYDNIDFEDLDETIEWIGYAINDFANSISCVDFNNPMTFFEVADKLQKVIEGSDSFQNKSTK